MNSTNDTNRRSPDMTATGLDHLPADPAPDDVRDLVVTRLTSTTRDRMLVVDPVDASAGAWIMTSPGSMADLVAMR